jgi:hypothetical protein
MTLVCCIKNPEVVQIKNILRIAKLPFLAVKTVAVFRHKCKRSPTPLAHTTSLFGAINMLFC